MGVGGNPLDEARLPRGPRGEKEGEGVILKGCLPWDGGGSEGDDRGGAGCREVREKGWY